MIGVVDFDATRALAEAACGGMPRGRFLPRGACGHWDPVFLWLYQGANLALAAAYLGIGVLMLRLMERRTRVSGSLPQGPVHEETYWDRVQDYLAWCLFFMLCGGGHVLDGAGAFYVPAYHFLAVWHALTAVVSWYALWRLWRFARRMG